MSEIQFLWEVGIIMLMNDFIVWNALIKKENTQIKIH